MRRGDLVEYSFNETEIFETLGTFFIRLGSIRHTQLCFVVLASLLQSPCLAVLDIKGVTLMLIYVSM